MNNNRTSQLDADCDDEEQSPEELREAMLDAYYEDMSIEDHR